MIDLYIYYFYEFAERLYFAYNFVYYHAFTS